MAEDAEKQAVTSAIVMGSIAMLELQNRQDIFPITQLEEILDEDDGAEMDCADEDNGRKSFMFKVW